MIELKNVSKTYENGTKALKDVTLSIKQGEFVFVVGASGAGKSTFLKLILREEVPTSGGIVVNGYDLVSIPKKEIPYFRRTMGVVFQDFRLIQTMTVFDNVAFAMRVIGANEREIRKRVPYVLSLVGLASKARNLPAELSGGEQQRVALARALVNNAAMIIADEPTGNVDPEMSYEIVELLNHINASGTTVVMVTHEHDLVRQFNHRTVVIENGSITYDGAGGDNFGFSSESAQHLHEINRKAEEKLKHTGMTGYYDIAGVDETSKFISSYLSEKGYESSEASDFDEDTKEQADIHTPEKIPDAKKSIKFSWNKLAVKIGKGKKEEKVLWDSDSEETAKAEEEKKDKDSSEVLANVSEDEKDKTVINEGNDITDNNADSSTEKVDSAEDAQEHSSDNSESTSQPEEKQSEVISDEDTENSSDSSNANEAEQNKESSSSDSENGVQKGKEASDKREEAVRDALGKSIKESLLEGYSFYLNSSDEKEDNGGGSDAK